MGITFCVCSQPTDLLGRYQSGNNWANSVNAYHLLHLIPPLIDFFSLSITKESDEEVKSPSSNRKLSQYNAETEIVFSLFLTVELIKVKLSVREVIGCCFFLATS